jgi:hypothetical protein
MNLNLNSLANRFAKAAQSEDDEPEIKAEVAEKVSRPSQRPMRRPGSGNFVNSWR